NGAFDLLHIDDSASVRLIVSRTLTSRGHRVTSCATPDEALRQDGSFDVAIIDLHLGANMDGVELAELLLVLKICNAVVFLTGSTHTALRTKAEKWGPVVIKAESTDLLLDALHQVAGSGPPSDSGP
ncbi:MAG: response regulator, partial [Myxococcota bacterium]